MPAKFFGYIEGFYGKLLTWEERLFLVNQLAQLGLNAYMYAPKEDVNHRLNWRKAFPNVWIKNYKHFIKKSNQKNVRIISTISPGLDIDYQSKTDYQQLLKKIITLLNCGSNNIALLMDDIPLKITGPARVLGGNHAELLTKLKLDLKKRDNKFNLLFCPTTYSEEILNFSGGKEYLDGLSEDLPQNIPLFWTGPMVVSQSISIQSLKTFQNKLRNPLIIWDNFFANDYCPTRLPLIPYKGRPSEMLKIVSGVMLNPIGLPYTDSLFLNLLSVYKKRHSSKYGWDKLKKIFPKQLHNCLILFSGDLSNSKMPSTFKLNKMLNDLNYLTFKWDSPLRIEWFPYLQTLTRDLKLLLGINQEKIQGNLMVRYNPILREVLQKNIFKNKIIHSDKSSETI